MKKITYECPRADCQEVFTIETNNNWFIYRCPECMTKVNKNNIKEEKVCQT